MVATMAREIAAPPFVPRPWGLATDAFDDLSIDDSVRWMRGVTMIPRGCPDVTATDVPDDLCTDIVFRDALGFDGITTFLPFRIELGLNCSNLGGLSAADIKGYATESLQVATSAVVERQLISRPYNSRTPSLGSTATVVTTSDHSPLGALAAVEAGLAQKLLNAQGIIHVTVSTLVFLKSNGAVQLIDGQLYSPSGHRVVADAGNNGAAPNGQAALAGQQWIYGSSRVRYTTTPIRAVGDDWENIDLSRNNQEILIERYGILVFETCPTVAAQADVPTIGDLAGGL